MRPNPRLTFTSVSISLVSWLVTAHPTKQGTQDLLEFGIQIYSCLQPTNYIETSRSPWITAHDIVTLTLSPRKLLLSCTHQQHGKLH
ncbi:hypothetical protein BDV23DRAFT_135128 [Aspergillus alliaceus]|uniref:Secreted protein n=1 Tax=Petromyces alliaceus TaxID=209559 RepID=A0A5N7CLL8_PETAA|nr:hypothetical protein BDV23DRAFT_135128 [Aspergillus alliaceus]